MPCNFNLCMSFDVKKLNICHINFHVFINFGLFRISKIIMHFSLYVNHTIQLMEVLML